MVCFVLFVFPEIKSIIKSGAEMLVYVGDSEAPVSLMYMGRDSKARCTGCCWCGNACRAPQFALEVSFPPNFI